MLSALLSVTVTNPVVFGAAVGSTDFALSSTTTDFPPLRPILGWSSWNTFNLDVTEDIVVSSAKTMASNGLAAAGYEYILIDDGWTAAQRDSKGNLDVNLTKFPSGFKNLTDSVHQMGLKVGIYTSVSAVTCGGYVGSLNHEVQDAKWFVEMGFDFVKHDTCGTDCSVHDGCIQNATKRMGSTLRAEGARVGKQIVYYLDHGNPVNPQQLYNPRNFNVANKECIVKTATKAQELVWVWAGADGSDEWGPHMFKSWFDRSDKWLSLLSNVHNQIRVAEWHRCGFLHFPDMPTCGQGAFSIAECRSEFALYSILGASLILGADIRSQPSEIVQLWTNKEMLEIARDEDCVQGSLTDNSQEAGEIWVRPLHDGTFAAVLFNKGSTALELTLTWLDDGRWNSFYPATFIRASLRNVFTSTELGVFTVGFTATVQPHDSIFLRVSPQTKTDL